MEIKKISELFGVAAPDSAQMEVSEPSFDTPEIDPAYAFTSDQVRRLQTWWFGKVKKALFLTGPTGCGKTTLIEQFAARLGADVMIVPCHGKLDMAELIGSMGIAKDGSTYFQYGTGVKAMKHPRPCVLLLDELNFVSPGSIGLLNRITELKPFTITETGEIIQPMPWIRIAATGNAVDRGDDSASYRGTQTMNVALLNRFLGMRMTYMDALQEAGMLNQAVPGLHPKLIESLVELAGEVRHGFEQNTLGVVMSTRTLIDMAQALFDRRQLVAKKPVDEVSWAMEFCLTDLARPEDRDVIGRLIQDKFHGLKLDKVKPGASPMPKAFQAAPATATNAEVHMWINPDRGPNGATIWGYVENAGHAHSFNAVVAQATLRDGVVRDNAWITSKIADKETNNYQRVRQVCPIFLPSGVNASKDEVLEALMPIAVILKGMKAGQTTSIPAHQEAFFQEALRLIA